jgi:hypothetical protein
VARAVSIITLANLLSTNVVSLEMPAQWRPLPPCPPLLPGPPGDPQTLLVILVLLLLITFSLLSLLFLTNLRKMLLRLCLGRDENRALALFSIPNPLQIISLISLPPPSYLYYLFHHLIISTIHYLDHGEGLLFPTSS